MGQKICFQCQTKDSSTLTDALVTSYFHPGHFRAILSCVIYKYINIHKWDQGIYFRGSKLILVTLTDALVTRYMPCWSFQINFIV